MALSSKALILFVEIVISASHSILYKEQNAVI